MIVLQLLVGVHAAAEVIVGKAALAAHAHEAGVLQPESPLLGAGKGTGVVAVGQEAIVVAGQTGVHAAVEGGFPGKRILQGKLVHIHGVLGRANGNLAGSRQGVHQGVHHHAVLNVAANVGAESPFPVRADKTGLHHVDDVVVLLQQGFHLFDMPEDPAHRGLLLAHVGIPAVRMAEHQFGASLANVLEFLPYSLQHRRRQVLVHVVHEVQSKISKGAVPAPGRRKVRHRMGLGGNILAEMQFMGMVGAPFRVAEITRKILVSEIVGKGRLGRLVGIYYFHGPNPATRSRPQASFPA